MPISSQAPVPNVWRIARSRSTAVGGTRLPMVEPGKKPSLGASRHFAASSIGRMKSASTLSIGRSGNSSASVSADWRRKSPEISIGM
jgi:hypothetical protein